MNENKKTNKTIVFLDDCVVFNKVMEDGFLRCHPISHDNKIIVLKNAKQLFDLTNANMQIDYLVIDYHLSSMSDGLKIAELMLHSQPNCKVWMYSGMTKMHILDDRLGLLDRFIHKDYGVPYLLDELYKALIK